MSGGDHPVRYDRKDCLHMTSRSKLKNKKELTHVNASQDAPIR